MKCPVAWIGFVALVGIAPSIAHGQSQSPAGETRSGRLAGETRGKGERNDTNPIDRFAVSRSNTGTVLTFDNAAVRVSVTQVSSTYNVEWFALDNRSDARQPSSGAVSLVDGRVTVPHAAWGPADDHGFRYAFASIGTLHPANTHWAKPVVVTIRERGGELDIVGIDRPTEMPAERINHDKK